MHVFFCGNVRIPRTVCYCDVIIGSWTFFGMPRGVFLFFYIRQGGRRN